MDKINLVTKFQFGHNFHQKIYSAGPDLYFSHPCVGYIKKGYAKFLYNGKTIYAYEGDLIYIAAETKYQSIWYGSPNIEWLSVHFDFAHKYVFSNYRFQILSKFSGELFEKIKETHQTDPLLCISYFYKLLDNVYKKLQSSAYLPVYKTIEPAIEYIENNFNTNISIAFLAKLCNYSESGFFKFFKGATGVTPISYKHNIMIQHSIELLKNTTFSIEEISCLVGFSSPNYFRKIFLKLTDKTPKELRKKDS